jgi:hypothetical protein
MKNVLAYLLVLSFCLSLVAGKHGNYKKGKYTKFKKSDDIEIIDKDKKTFDNEHKRRFDETMQRHAEKYSENVIKKYNKDTGKFEYHDNADNIHKIGHDGYTFKQKTGIERDMRLELNSGIGRIKNNKKTGEREYQLYDYEEKNYSPAKKSHSGFDALEEEEDYLKNMMNDSSSTDVVDEIIE